MSTSAFSPAVTVSDDFILWADYNMKRRSDGVVFQITRKSFDEQVAATQSQSQQADACVNAINQNKQAFVNRLATVPANAYDASRKESNDHWTGHAAGQATGGDFTAQQYTQNWEKGYRVGYAAGKKQNA